MFSEFISAVASTCERDPRITVDWFDDEPELDIVIDEAADIVCIRDDQPLRAGSPT